MLAGLCYTVPRRREDRQHGSQRPGNAEVVLDAAGVGISAAHRANYERDLAAVRAMLGVQVFEAAWAAGQAMTVGQAIAYALEENVDARSEGHHPQPLTP